jgi:hypothetical protein
MVRFPKEDTQDRQLHLRQDGSVPEPLSGGMTRFRIML